MRTTRTHTMSSPPGGASVRRWLAALAIAAVLVAPAAARAQKSPTAQASLARAYERLLVDDFAQAAAEMETAVRFEPRFAYGWYLLASTSRRAGDPDRAAFAYRRYAELRPTEPDPYFGLGLSLEAAGDRAGALAALRRFLESEHPGADASFVEEARRRAAALESAVRDRGQASVAKDGQAAALLAAHKFAEAAALLRDAIARAPADAGAWYKLGFALRQAGQPVEAAKAYRRSITLQPSDADAYYGLGQVLVAANRPDEALDALRTYVKAGKGDARWISKARQEIARLEGLSRPSRPVAPTATAPRPAAASTSPAPASKQQPGPASPPPDAAAASSLASAPPHAVEPTPAHSPAAP